MNFTWTKTGVLAVAALSSSAAFAADISFNFRVNSSGVRLYPCDAGLFDRSGDSFIQASVDHSYTPDKISITYVNEYLLANEQLHTDNPGYNFRTLAYPAGLPDGSTLGTKFQTIIRNIPFSDFADTGVLTFNLASQRYGAKYFVDFCYVGTQIDTSAVNYASNLHNYLITDKVTAVDILTAGYLQDSGVKVYGKWVCEDVESATGDVTFPGVSSTKTTNITDSFASNLYGLGGSNTVASNFLTSASGTSSVSTTAPSIPVTNAAAKYVFDGITHSNNVSLTHKINKCVIRYIFEETNDAPRKWDLRAARFVIDLNLQKKRN